MNLSARDEERLSVVSKRWKLTKKETRVLGEWAFTENSIDQIAKRLGNAPGTVRHHIKNIRGKARVHSRAELIRRIFHVAEQKPGRGRIRKLPGR